jgi:hypothetical protein
MTNRSMPWAAIAREFTGTVKNAAQAAKMAGLDFDVPLVECGYRSPVTNRWVVTPSRRAVVRVEGKDETFYEYVSDDYTTLPYGTAFGFLDDLDARYVAAGDFAEGRQGFVVVQIPSCTTYILELARKPVSYDVYLVVRSSHNKSRGLECSVLLRDPDRGIALTFSGTADVPQRWSSRHIGTDPASRIANAQETERRLHQYLIHVADVAGQLDQIVLDTEDAEAILEAVLPEKTRRGRQVAGIINIWNDKTGFGLVHATAEFMMWSRADGLRTDRSRFTDVLTGTTHTTINKVASAVLLRGV